MINRSHTMRPFSLCFFLLGALIVAPVAGSAAQWHHVHLTVPDTKVAAEWYAKSFGGEVAVTAGFDTAIFGKTLVRMRRARGEVLGSEGSVLDHIGFSVPDLDAKIEELEAAGVKVTLQPRPFRDIKISFVEDPWGTRIEVVQDPDLFGFHHIHLHVPDAAEALAWFSGMFGGEPATFAGVLPAIRYGDMWILAQNARGEKAPTEGRSVDHIGFSFTDYDAGVALAKSKDVKFLMEPRQSGDHRVAFVEGPGGLKIELYELK